MSNITHVHCQCDHLTKFAGFVAPNPLNIREVFSKNILENPTGLILVLTVFMSYVMGVVWARKADRKDIAKVGVGLLPGQKLNPRKECQYVITVYTGFRGNAGTTAEITLVLYGSQYESPPFTLRDDNRCLFEQGSVDSFLVSSEEPLGVLTHIRVWHNNAGFSPSWYLSQIIVTDRGTNNTAHFLSNRWLAVDEDDGKIERIIPTAGKEEITKFQNLFFTKCTRDVTDDHLWYSVAGRPARSPFTRVQRLSCCLTLLYSTMVTNIMFFGRGDDFDPPQPLKIAGLEINLPISLPQLMIGLQSAAIILPVNFLVVFLFRNSGKQTTKKTDGKKLNLELGRRLLRLLRQRPMKMRDCASDNPDTPSFWYSRDRTVLGNKDHKLRVLQSSLDVDVEESSRKVRDDKTGLHQKSSLPWWGVLLGWFLVWSGSFVAAFFTVLYTLSFGREKAEAWVCTFVTSFVSDLFLVQPVKLVLVAMIFALFTKKPVVEEDPPPTSKGDDEEYVMYKEVKNVN
ncbi:polycystin-1-like protein 2 [Branchiostoma floridae x Branchiostoma belcheri]